MLIKINTKGLIPIRDLWRLVLKFIFDQKHCAEGTKYVIENNIEKYYNIVREHKKKLVDIFGNEIVNETQIGKKGNEYDEIEYQIMAMSKYLVMDEKGELDYKKELYREHGIDYRKTKEFGFAFPECRPDKKRLAQAQEYLRKNNEDNKEFLN